MTGLTSTKPALAPTPFDLSEAQARDWQVAAFDIHTFFPKRSRYAVGISVLNENGRIRKQLQTMQALGIFTMVDVVIIDGGSTDGSLELPALEQLGLRAFLLKRGPGKLSAQMRIFFTFALLQGYEGVVILDGNNKDGVDAIPNFLKRLEDGWDYVQGSRFVRGGIAENTPFLRHVGVKFVHAPILSLAARFRYTDTTNGFRAISRRFLLDPRLQPFRDVFDTYNLHFYMSLMAARLGFRVCEIPVRRSYPKNGALPSKIRGMRANIHILTLLFKTIRGDYAPPKLK